MSETTAMSDAHISLANMRASMGRLQQRVKQWRKLLGVESNDDVDDALRRLADARGQHEKLAAELDTLKKQVGTPDEKDARIAELQASIRQRDHRDLFRAEALKAGVSAGHADKLYKLSDLAPPKEGDLDPKPIAEFLGKAKTTDPWAFGESTPAAAGGNAADAAQATQGAGQAATPPPGAGRSASVPTPSQVRYTLAEINQAGWERRRPELVEAIKAGHAVLAD